MPLSIIDVFIFLHLYGLYIVPPMVGGFIAFLVRYLAFPLLTRNPCELAIIVGSDKVKIIKVTNRYLPFFTTKMGAYWFSEAKTLKMKSIVIEKTKAKKPGLFSKNKQPEIIQQETVRVEKTPKYSPNKIHVYVDAVNQPIYDLIRKTTKTTDLVIHHKPIKQTASHSVWIPPTFSSFRRNWALIIDGDKCIIEPTKYTQPYKINLFSRLGVYITEQQEAESSNISDQLQSITVQTVVQKIGDIEQNANFSASYALKILKTMRSMDRNWVRTLTGQMDMRLIMILIGAIAAVAGIILLNKPPSMESLGPMPGTTP